MTVVEDTEAALATGPLCDHCLGRLFAERSFGLANKERGRSLRVALAVERDDPFEPDEDCWVCEGECARIEWWATQAATAVQGYEFDTYQVGTKVPPLLEENDTLLRDDIGFEEDAGEALKTEFNREVGKLIGQQTDSEVEFGRPEIQFTLDLSTDAVDVKVNSAFIYGRYRKLTRDIPQTKWPCNDCNGTGRRQGTPCDGCSGSGYRYDRSVEQLTAPVVVDAMDGESGTFHGAGREDVDALMLESGRPFVIEVDAPRIRDVDVEALEADINEFADGDVEVTGLRRVTHDMVERVKELDASKTYRMDVTFGSAVTETELQDALEELAGTTIQQETPQRVTHRRADITRTRDVYSASGTRQDETSAELRIHGEGGLYVKELVSSDEGRTEPSLSGLLGVESTVTALDVVDVQGENEPFVDESFVIA